MEIELLKLICPNCVSKIVSLKQDNLHFCSVCGKEYYLKDGRFVEVEKIYVKEKAKNDFKKISSVLGFKDRYRF